MLWTSLDTWIVIIGALTAMSCALPGCFLLLKRQSMMGDAISHAILPGIAIAFLIFHDRAPLTMLGASIVTGIVTAVLVQLVQRAGNVEEGTAMGVVFTTLFAAGLILIRQAADHVDLDPDCVLYGAVETAPTDVVRLLGVALPRAVLVSGSVLLINVVLVVLLYKELKLSSFDPGLADTLGFNSQWLHYGLMAVTAASMVAAFETAGSILVIAMVVVPPAAAYLLTDRLWLMLLLSVVIAGAGAALGHLGAITVPGLVGFEGMDTNSAGMMAVATGLLFCVALLLGPRYGLVSRVVHRARLRLRILADDALGVAYRLEEIHGAPQLSVAPHQFARVLGGGPMLSAALWRLRMKGLLERASAGLRLTERGTQHARRIVRSHRQWEAYLVSEAGVRADHVHRSAERLQHVTSDELEVELTDATSHLPRDPHDREIPPKT